MGKKISIHIVWCFVGALIAATVIGVANDLAVSMLIVRSVAAAAALSGVLLLIRHIWHRFAPEFEWSAATSGDSKGSTIDISVGDDINIAQKTTPISQSPSRSSLDKETVAKPSVASVAADGIGEYKRSPRFSQEDSVLPTPTATLRQKSLKPTDVPPDSAPSRLTGDNAPTVATGSASVAGATRSAQQLRDANSPETAVDTDQATAIIREWIQ